MTKKFVCRFDGEVDGGESEWLVVVNCESLLEYQTKPMLGPAVQTDANAQSSRAILPASPARDLACPSLALLGPMSLNAVWRTVRALAPDLLPT
jgi:hypothetical protein